MIDRVSFIGGMNVSAVLGRANATVPLAELIIDEHTLTLRPRGIVDPRHIAAFRRAWAGP